MNLLEIRKKANHLAVKNASKIVPIYICVELVLLFVMMVSNDIISIVLSLFASTITHAYVLISLKAVAEKQIFVRKDALVGLRDYTRLFPSYIMRKIIVNLSTFLLVLPTILIIQLKTGFILEDLLSWVQFVIVAGLDNITTFPTLTPYLTSPLVMATFLFGSVLSLILSYGFALMPYLVEKQDIAWTEAMVKSWRMMTGHKKELLMLRLSYLPQMIFIYATIQLISALVSFSLFMSTFLTLTLSLYLPIMFYQPHLEIANALFYTELIDQEEHPDLFVL